MLRLSSCTFSNLNNFLYIKLHNVYLGSVQDCLKPYKNLFELHRVTGISLQSISSNILYIVKCCLEALDYLAMRNMQHHDVKGDSVNITRNMAGGWSGDEVVVYWRKLSFWRNICNIFGGILCQFFKALLC